MADFYFDSKATDNGDGTERRPYNDINKLATIPWPATALLKRGSSWKANVVLPTMAYTTLSTITVYGEGAPVELSPKDYTKPVISCPSNCKFLHIDGKDFGMRFVFSEGVVYSAQRSIHLRCDSLSGSDNNANVKVRGLTAVYKCPVIADQTFIYLDGIGSATVDRSQDNLVIEDIRQYGGDSGGFIWGGSTYDLSAGQTDRRQARNAVIRNYSAVGAWGDVATVRNAIGMADNQSHPDYEKSSKIVNCFSTQDGRYNATSATARFHVPFWVYGCTNVPIEYCWADGGMLINDCMGFDIDGLCDGCVVRYCISSNNAGGFMMFTCTKSNAIEGTVNNLAELEAKLITQKLGNYNNRCEYVLSYNDGVGRGGYAGRWTLMQFNFNIMNASVSNCTIIDTRSRFASHYFLATATTKGINYGLIDKYPSKVANCVFYHKFKHMEPGNQFYASVGTAERLRWSNNIFWCPEDKGESMIPTKGVMNANQKVDPGFIGLNDSAPQGFDAAKMVRLAKGAAAFTAGTNTGLPDIWGNIGRAAGWQQQEV